MDKTDFPLRGDMEMEIRKLDLYRAVDREAPEGAAAELWCYIQHTSGEVTRSRRRPAVLILPGGGYGYVSEREAEPVALRFAARGWSAFVLTYSVAPHKFPTALRQAAMAMRWIRENAAEMEVDPGKVAAMGFSQIKFMPAAKESTAMGQWETLGVQICTSSRFREVSASISL